MTESEGRSGAGYWYPTAAHSEQGTRSPDADTADPGTRTEAGENRRPTAVDVLNALRAYRAIESGVRRRLGQRLSVNETDLAALRYLLGNWQADKGASPKELALALSISSASTTLVIDRLENAGFIRRRRHPVDRRAVILEPGDKATEEFRAAFDIEKRGVLAAAERLSVAETETVTRFLRNMERAIGEAIGSQDRPHTS